MVTRVAVIGGGWSIEAEVSRVSASEIANALKNRYDVQYVELTRSLGEELAGIKPEVVFPVLHGCPGEDGSVQGLLDLLNYPYVGSGMVACVIGINKSFTKTLVRRAGVPVLEELLVNRSNMVETIVQVKQQFNDQIVCKPNHGGSAVGVQLLPKGGDVQKAILNSLEHDSEVLIEPFRSGREMTVGVLDLHQTETVAFPVTEILVAEGEWYDYTNRYTPGQSEHVIPADIDEDLARRMQVSAINAHRIVGCRDFSRTDFLLEPSGQYWFLEVNCIPGMTPTSLYPDGARAIGISFEDLTDKLVQSAKIRGTQDV